MLLVETVGEVLSEPLKETDSLLVGVVDSLTLEDLDADLLGVLVEVLVSDCDIELVRDLVLLGVPLNDGLGLGLLDEVFDSEILDVGVLVGEFD